MSNEIEHIVKRVARITDTELGFEDHGILTVLLRLDYGGSGQGAGLKALGGESLEKEIRGILRVTKVNHWESVKGRTLYAYANHARVYAIEQLEIDGDEFYAFDDSFQRFPDGSVGVGEEV